MSSINKKITSPNYTQTPNILLDYWMPLLSPSEFKVIMYICRKTFGYHRNEKDLSRSEIAEKTGLSEETVRKAITVLLSYELIIKHEHFSERYGNEANTYSINVYDQEIAPPTPSDTPPQGQNLAKGGAIILPPSLKPTYIPLKKEEKKDIAQSPKSALRKSDPCFNFESGKFEGISEEELKKWQLLYPSVNIPQEILRMEEWCLSNPSKAKSKKLWRKFISGWLARNNEEITNKEAYKQSKNQGDRRPLDISGKPVSNPLEGRF